MSFLPIIGSLVSSLFGTKASSSSDKNVRAFGSLLNQGSNILNSGIGQDMSYQYQNKLLGQQLKNWKQMQREAMKLQLQGMSEAGINPQFANGSQVAPTPSSPVAPASSVHTQTSADVLNYANANLANSQAANVNTQNEWLPAILSSRVNETKSKIRNLDADAQKKLSETFGINLENQFSESTLQDRVQKIASDAEQSKYQALLLKNQYSLEEATLAVNIDSAFAKYELLCEQYETQKQLTNKVKQQIKNLREDINVKRAQVRELFSRSQLQTSQYIKTEFEGQSSFYQYMKDAIDYGITYGNDDYIDKLADLVYSKIDAQTAEEIANTEASKFEASKPWLYRYLKEIFGDLVDLAIGLIQYKVAGGRISAFRERTNVIDKGNKLNHEIKKASTTEKTFVNDGQGNLIPSKTKVSYKTKR